MSVRMRHTRAHTNNRRSHHALAGVKGVKDKESGNLRLPHRVDEATGMYRGKQIFTPKAKKPAHEVKGPSEKVKAIEAPKAAAEKHANAEVKAVEHTDIKPAQEKGK